MLRLPDFRCAAGSVATLTVCCLLLTACGSRAPLPDGDEEPAARHEVSPEAVQAVLEGQLSKFGNRRDAQLEALTRAVAADGTDTGLRLAFAEALFLADRADEARMQLRVAEGLGAAPWERVLVAFPYTQRKESVAATLALFATAPPTGAPERYFRQWRQVAGREGVDAERAACTAWSTAFPTEPGGWGCLGDVALKAGHTEEAAEQFRRAAEAGSEHDAGSFMEALAGLQPSVARHDAAVAVAGRFKQSLSVTTGLARLQEKAGEAGEAAACVTLAGMAARIGGNARRYADALERVRASLGGERLHCFITSALATRSRNGSMVLASAAAYDAAGRFDRARPLLEQAVLLDPSNALALNQLGYSLAERSLDLSAALGYLERAHRLRPEDGGILDSLAWVYFRLGRFAEAEPLSRKAIELAGQGAVLVDHLGDILWALGRKEEAVERWRFAFQNADGESEDVLTTVPEKLKAAGAPLYLDEPSYEDEPPESEEGVP